MNAIQGALRIAQKLLRATPHGVTERRSPPSRLRRPATEPPTKSDSAHHLLGGSASLCEDRGRARDRRRDYRRRRCHPGRAGVAMGLWELVDHRHYVGNGSQRSGFMTEDRDLPRLQSAYGNGVQGAGGTRATLRKERACCDER